MQAATAPVVAPIITLGVCPVRLIEKKAIGIIRKTGCLQLIGNRRLRVFGIPVMVDQPNRVGQVPLRDVIRRVVIWVSRLRITLIRPQCAVIAILAKLLLRGITSRDVLELPGDLVIVGEGNRYRNGGPTARVISVNLKLNIELTVSIATGGGERHPAIDLTIGAGQVNIANVLAVLIIQLNCGILDTQVVTTVTNREIEVVSGLNVLARQIKTEVDVQRGILVDLRWLPRRDFIPTRVGDRGVNAGGLDLLAARRLGNLCRRQRLRGRRCLAVSNIHRL